MADPPGTAHGVTITWYAVAAAAAALAGMAMRDRWHRYAHGPRRRAGR